MSSVTPIEWDIVAGDDVRPTLAVAYLMHGRRLVLFAFGSTEAGPVELVAVRAESVPAGVTGSTAHLAVHVQRLTESWSNILPREGVAIRSTDLRMILADVPGLLGEARHQLRRRGSLIYYLAFDAASVRQWDEDDLQLARDLAQYQADTKPGARRRFAVTLGVPETEVKAMIERARKRGVWVTNGRGRLGGLNPEVAALIDEGE